MSSFLEEFGSKLLMRAVAQFYIVSHLLSVEMETAVKHTHTANGIPEKLCPSSAVLNLSAAVFYGQRNEQMHRLKTAVTLTWGPLLLL